MIIPSIDIMGGKAVQLRNGEEKILERGNIMELAREFSRYGELAVIDLDAAMGTGNNSGIVKKLCGRFDCRVGGGIRTEEKAREMLKAGARKIIVGTKAEKSFLEKFPKEKIIVAVDTRNGKLAIKGWKEGIEIAPEERIKELEGYCSEFLYTDIGREGMMKGADIERAKQLKKLTKNRITLAGGISTAEEIAELERNGINSQIGMALYTRKIDLADAFASALDFSKGSIIPTIVEDENGQVLMLSNSSRGSLKKALIGGKGIYYSRKREGIWMKGETSGCTQELLKARYDCDMDALLFTVKQKGAACHNGSYSCFGGRKFSLETLQETIMERISNGAISYSRKLSRDRELLNAKIREEAKELVEFKGRENLIWEAADLLYFTLVLLSAEGIELKEVISELDGRQKSGNSKPAHNGLKTVGCKKFM